MTIISRDFKGIWIPREIWLRKDISALERSLWAEIHSLYDHEEGGCYASNEYLCEFFDVKERRLQEMISNLKEKGLIVQISFNGRKRVLKAIEPKEHQETRTSEVQKSAPLGCGKMHLLDAEKCGSPNIYRTKEITKNNDVEKSDKKNVVVPSFIQEIDGITEEDKKILSRYPEERVRLALKFNKEVKPIKSKIQQLMWHCGTNKPITSNKSEKSALRKEFENWCSVYQSKTCNIEIENDEAIFIHSGQGEPLRVKFSEENAREKLSELTKKYKFYRTVIRHSKKDEQ